MDDTIPDTAVEAYARVVFPAWYEEGWKGIPEAMKDVIRRGLAAARPHLTDTDLLADLREWRDKLLNEFTTDTTAVRLLVADLDALIAKYAPTPDHDTTTGATRRRANRIVEQKIEHGTVEVNGHRVYAFRVLDGDDEGLIYRIGPSRDARPPDDVLCGVKVSASFRPDHDTTTGATR
jgi:hypothetical protein